jgi:multidrug efflux pump subunit AcrA (membrane-fusion protein)
MRAEREALLLHGLSDEQIQTIEKERRLIRELVIRTPEPDSDHASGAHQDYLQVAKLAINRGDHVTTGTPLAILSDHCELYIEGSAFEQDAQVLNQVANAGAAVSALIESQGEAKRELSGLRILYVEDQVDRDSRALKFHVALTNELVRNEATPDGHRFISWRYKPGQRVEVLVPVARWEKRVVLPVQAVVQEGAEWFVFPKHGNHFDRQPVHVEYRDQQWAVLGSDGTLVPGQQVAADGAYQIHLAIKNKAGGGADPHAGHNH